MHQYLETQKRVINHYISIHDLVNAIIEFENMVEFCEDHVINGFEVIKIMLNEKIKEVFDVDLINCMEVEE